MVFIQLSVLLFLASLAGAQQPTQQVAEPDTFVQRTAPVQLRQVLAAPRELAFAQVLVGVEVLRDPADTSRYDMVVRFDPERYRDPHLGRYPLTFEDQCVLWGKRLALYSLIVPWKSNRFYLHDISTGRQVWVDLADARELFPPYAAPPKAKTFAAWLPFIYGVPRSTEPRALGVWMRLMQEESRDLVIYRLRAAAAPDTALPADSLRGQ